MTTIRLRLLSQRKNVSSDYSVLKARPSKKYWTDTQKCVILIQSNWSVSMTVRFHLFPFRTQKLSLLVPKIVSWKRLVKIGSRRLLYGPLVKWLRHGPFTAVTWVRFPYGSPYWCNRIDAHLEKLVFTSFFCVLRVKISGVKPWMLFRKKGSEPSTIKHRQTKRQTLSGFRSEPADLL